MARRLKSLQRSRRSPFLLREGSDRFLTGAYSGLANSSEAGRDPEAAEVDLQDSINEPPPIVAPLPPADPGSAREEPPTSVLPAPAATPVEVSPTASHAPTGWDWFAQWPFPTQLFLFAAVLAAGMWWLDHREPAVAAPVDPPPVARPAPKKRPPLRPETFDWLNRLRETQVVTSQLEAEFATAQEFYREYALDEFLDFDPWSLGPDEVVALTHFCDEGYFTVEREILVKILERRVMDAQSETASAPRGALDRLEAAAHERESRLAGLREAAELYRRGRTAEVQIPEAVTPEQDQAQRAQLVDKLAAVRRERERLNARIDQLNAMLR
ncbi:MAG: hypothetical protein ACKV19_21725 [Verrucomicrobiales bacterium]